jgi:hypothetical protein
MVVDFTVCWDTSNGVLGSLCSGGSEQASRAAAVAPGAPAQRRRQKQKTAASLGCNTACHPVGYA